MHTLLSTCFHSLFSCNFDDQLSTKKNHIFFLFCVLCLDTPSENTVFYYLLPKVSSAVKEHVVSDRTSFEKLRMTDKVDTGKNEVRKNKRNILHNSGWQSSLNYKCGGTIQSVRNMGTANVVTEGLFDLRTRTPPCKWVFHSHTICTFME